MVLALASLHRNPHYLRDISVQEPDKIPIFSIIIPSLNRPESLEKCLISISHQTFKDYEVIVCGEEGPLTKIRNQGARKANGKYLVFIDDDVSVSAGWLISIYETFEQRPEVGGVSGPAIIRDIYRNGRDLFRFRFFKWLYDVVFLGKMRLLPGHFTKAGAWTTGACEQFCNYIGEVHFLEACNMAFTRDAFEAVGGFDETYRGVGDWSEPDIAFKIRKLGYRLWFTRDAKLFHNPSTDGAFLKRKSDSRNRLSNYYLFSKRWIKPCFHHLLYKLFLEIYYGIKSLK